MAVATSGSLAAVFWMISHNFHLPLETKHTRCFVDDNRIIFHGYDLRARDLLSLRNTMSYEASHWGG